MKILDSLIKIIKWCFWAALIAVLAAMLIRILYYGYTKMAGTQSDDSNSGAVTNSITNAASSTISSVQKVKSFSFKLPPPGSWSFNLSDPNTPIDWESREPVWDESANWSNSQKWDTQESWDNSNKWDTQKSWATTTYDNRSWKYDNVLDYKKKAQ